MTLWLRRPIAQLAAATFRNSFTDRFKRFSRLQRVHSEPLSASLPPSGSPGGVPGGGSNASRRRRHRRRQSTTARPTSNPTHPSPRSFPKPAQIRSPTQPEHNETEPRTSVRGPNEIGRLRPRPPIPTEKQVRKPAQICSPLTHARCNTDATNRASNAVKGRCSLQLLGRSIRLAGAQQCCAHKSGTLDRQWASIQSAETNSRSNHQAPKRQLIPKPFFSQS